MFNPYAECFFSKEIRQIDKMNTKMSTTYPHFLWKVGITPKND